MTSLRRLGRRGTFLAACLVLALVLWSSGAPSVLYPLYAQRWSLPSVVITSVFGAYPVALMLTLLLIGGVSDIIGRRRTMIIGVATIAIAAAVFAIAPDVGMLYVGRVLQGVGTGFALGAAAAALVENNPGSNPRLPGAVTTASTALGLTAALVISGILAQLAPLPFVLSYAVLFVLALVSIGSLLLAPDDRPADRQRWRPRAPRVPRSVLRPFIAATLGVSLSYAVGAIFLSLGSTMARQLTHTENLIVVGATLGVSALSIGVTALLIQRMNAHLAIALGAVVSIVALVVMVATAASGSFVLLLVWCIVGGAGYSMASTGGITLLNRTAAAEHRGASLSLLYLFSYLVQAVAAIGIGAVATAAGLGIAIDVAGVALGILSLATLVAAVADLALARRSVVLAA